MNCTITDIVFILDRSGSMQGLEKDTIGGYNSLLKKQKNEEGAAYVSTVLFDDKHELIHDRTLIDEVNLLDESIYYTRGTTALLDAVGKTINHISKIRKQESSDQVLFVITTDGYENASKEYTAKHIKDLISMKKELGWEFLFLGANIDSESVGETFGIEEERVADYHADSKGTEVIYEALNDTVSNLRRHKQIDKQWKKSIESDYKKR
jgi:uncharacterized protein YegL